MRCLQPLHANASKRLVKSAKVYVRASGLVHTLLGLDQEEAVLAHPIAGASWEGSVVETLLSLLPKRAIPSFYRTNRGAEMDLVIDYPNGQRWAIEIKRCLTPKLSRSIHQAGTDLQPDRCFVVAPVQESYPPGDGVMATNVYKLAQDKS